MAINDGDSYVHGNLTRDWEEKTVLVKGAQTVIWTSAVAYNEFKDSEAVFVNLTCWPDPQGTDAPGKEIASKSGKGSRVVVHGPIKYGTFVKKDGSAGAGFSQSVYNLGLVVRPPWNGESRSNADVAKHFEGAEVTYADKTMEPF
jgi:hypothetical protein